MQVQFWMNVLEKEEFLLLPGISRLLTDLRRKGISWVYKGEVSDYNIDTPINLLLITDDMQLTVRCQKIKICCIGYQKEENSSYFSGVETVLCSFEDVTAEYLMEVHHHFHGIPVVIAETERLLIRESCMEDFDILYQISRESGNELYMETMSDNYEEEKEKFQAYISNVYRYFGFGLWTVIEKTNREIIGRCGISVVADEISPDGRNELGYIIKQSYRKNGYGKEACKAILKYVSEALDINPIHVVIHKENIPSQKLAEKLGVEFQEEKGEIQLYVYIEYRE